MIKKEIKNKYNLTEIKFKFLNLTFYKVCITDKIKRKYIFGVKFFLKYNLHDLGEIQYIKQNYKELLHPVEAEKFKNLIKNLDEKSIEAVSRGLNRAMICLTQKDVTTDLLFTQKELEQFELLEKTKILETIGLKDGIKFYHGWFLPNGAFEADVFDCECNFGEIKNKEKIKNKDILDVGAYIGDSACIFSKYTGKNVYAFEPCETNFKKLEKTIQLNNLKNVKGVKKGLGSQEKKEKIYFYEGSSSMAKISNAPSEEIEVTTLDNFVKENNLEVGLIKIDTEGFEQEVLKGAINTIKTQKPALIISIYHNFHDFFEIKPWIENLNLGYKFKIIAPTAKKAIVETNLIAEIN